MKAKVIIENSKSTITLEPENSFEETLLKDAHAEKGGLEIYIDKEYQNYMAHNYSVRILITGEK